LKPWWWAVLVLILFALFLPRAQAQTPTPGAALWTGASNPQVCPGTGGFRAMTVPATAAAIAAQFQGHISGCGPEWPQSCFASVPSNPGSGSTGAVVCDGQSYYTMSFHSAGASTCPGNSVSNGSGGCVCPFGTSSWLASDQQCYTRCGGVAGNMISIAGDFPRGTTKTCADGCEARLGFTSCSWGGKSCSTGATVSNVECVAGGVPGPVGIQEPAPVAGTDTPNPCAPSIGTVSQDGKTEPITLNGQVACVEPGSPAADTSRTDRTLTTNPDGTKTLETKRTRCVGTSCTTERETTAYNAGGTETGTGTTTGSGTGDGSGIELGEITDVALTDQARSGLVTPRTGFGTAGACPAPIPLPKGMQLEFTTVCSFASALRPLVLALAWLGAAFIVLGAGRKG